ncbi:MAG: ABC transporter ATP-binding protein [Peptostreptococcaceae bacterium]
MECIQIKNLTKRYKKNKALDNINLTINNGIYGLLGPNGAGKTTLIRTIATLLDIEEGQITYGDISWSDKIDVKRIIGYLPQDFYIYKNISVYDVLHHLCVLKNVDENKIDNEIATILDETDLTDYKEKKVKELSGGMLRRLGIAQAIINNPKILIVDEPTTGLDPEKRIEFRKTLSLLAENRIVIISTHIVEDIDSTCNQLCILDKGTILYEGTTSHLKTLADGSVYECIITKSELKNIEKSLKIIYISSIENKFKIKFISRGDVNVDGARNVSPTLEDAYMYIIGDRND